MTDLERALDEFMEHMRTVVIPEIEAVMRERARWAAQTRHLPLGAA